MKEEYRIYVDRLREGVVEKIKQVCSPEFLDVEEEDVRFEALVMVEGEAYTAEQSLILKVHIETTAIMPCSVCNEDVEVKLNIPSFYHCVPISEIKGNVLDFREVIREDILLETSEFAECNQGNCSKRKEIEKYMGNREEGQKPFADLEL